MQNESGGLRYPKWNCLNAAAREPSICQNLSILQLSFQGSHSVPVLPVMSFPQGYFRCADVAGKVGKSNRVAGPKSGISLRNEAPPPEVCGAAYRAKSGGSYFQRLKQSEKGSRGDGAADACLHMYVEKC